MKKRPEENSYKEIAKAIGISTALVKHKINGRDNMMGLETKGLVKKEYINPEEPKRGVMIHLISDDLDEANVKNTLVTLDTINNEEQKVPLILKWVIVISFLEWIQILIDNIVVSKLKILLEEEEEIYDIYDYNSMISLLEKSLKEIEDNVIYIQDTNNCTLEDLNFHNDFIKNKFKDFITFVSENSGSVTTTKNSSNQKLFNDIESSQDTTESIHSNHINNDFKKDVLKILTAKDDMLISEITKELRVYDEDQDTNFYMINKGLEELANNGAIAIYDNKVTKKKPICILKELLYKLLCKGDFYHTLNSIAEAVPDITPSFQDKESKLKKIKHFHKKQTIMHSKNGTYMIPKDFKDSFLCGGSQ